MSAAVLVPVGFPLGAQWWDDGSTRPGYAIRLGADLMTLTATEYDLWWQARFHPSAAELLAWADGDGMAAAGPAYGELRSAGLLTEVTPAGARDFSARHRLLPAGVGGGRPALDGACQVWDAGAEPLVELDRATYQCWAFSDGVRSIGDVVDLVQPAAGLPAAALLHRVLLALPVLAGAGAVVVDRLPS